MATADLPSTMKAVVAYGFSDGRVETVPVPLPGPGSVTVKVEHCLVHNNFANIYHGTTGLDFMRPPYPLIFGGYGVGRIAAVGPDTTAFAPGQLVMFDPFIRARDDPDVGILWGAFPGIDEKTQRWTKENWRDGAWAEYVRAPLENTWAINEDKINALGLPITHVAHIGPLAVAYGGLRKINLQAGETIVVAPATGVFSGGTVAVARAMGANVIAASRNAEGLRSVAKQFPGVKTVQLVGGPEDTAALQAHGPIDVFVDVSPNEATNHPSLAYGIASVRRYGRVCLMGGRADEKVPIPFALMIFNDLTIRGSWMYEPEHVRGLVKMVENGVLKLDENNGFEILGSFGMDGFEAGLEEARKCSAGKIYLLTPGQ